ncbi:MAG: transporter, partial [Paludibacter sp.]|nr:transporter [Paludibacter sp.]
MLKKIKGYAMPIGMVSGIVFYKWVSELSFITPYLIFTMLLLTFVKIAWREIRFTPMHFILAGIQIVGSISVYFILKPFNIILAQGAMMCFLAPTATSAPVITNMLKGNVASLTAYSLLSNLTVVIIAPLFFSYIGDNQEMTFLQSALIIARHVAFLLLVPFLAAFLLRKIAPKPTQFLQRHSGISFYLWIAALIIVVGRTVNFVIEHGTEHIWTEIFIALAAFVICGIQFYFGRRIGRRYGDTVAGGQGLGQKNTVLAIWMSQTYLN